MCNFLEASMGNVLTVAELLKSKRDKIIEPWFAVTDSDQSASESES